MPEPDDDGPVPAELRPYRVFLRTVRHMREAQRSYFRARRQGDPAADRYLGDSKRFEAAVDRQLSALLDPQPKLFGEGPAQRETGPGVIRQEAPGPGHDSRTSMNDSTALAGRNQSSENASTQS